MTSEIPLVSIVIVTRNRSRELKRAIKSCLAQSYISIEILVFDDASSDDTPDMIRTDYPAINYFRSDVRVGLIVLRNRGFAEARGKYVFSLDDDAYFVDADTVGQTVSDFGVHESICAVAIPFIEVSGQDPAMKIQQLNMAKYQSLRSYRGCAHAIKRSVAVKMGGYREFLVHQGEERDLCIRLIERRYRIIYGSASPLVHDYSPLREMPRMRYYGVRNTLLFDILNVPFPYVFGRLFKDICGLIFYTPRYVMSRLCCIMISCFTVLKFLPLRDQVSREAYASYRSLPGHGSIFVSRENLPPPI